MRKTLTILLLAIMLCLQVAPAAFAMDTNYVIDLADIIPFDDWLELEERAIEISEKYQCLVMIVTLDDMWDFGFNDLEDFTHVLYEEYHLGFGADRSCLMFALSLEDRDFDLRAWGFGNTAFTDHGKDVMLDRHILPLLRDDKYYEAFSAYLDKADEFLAMARGGRPFDIGTDPEKGREDFLIKLGITILLPILIALGLCLFWVSKMKTAKTARKADQYIPPGGFALTGQQDMFLYQTQTRVKIEKKVPSGGTTIGSRGSSGRKGKF